MRSSSALARLALCLLVCSLVPWPVCGQEEYDPLAVLGPDQEDITPVLGPESGPALQPYVPPPPVPKPPKPLTTRPRPPARPRPSGPVLMAKPVLPPPPQPRFEPAGPHGLTLAYPGAGAMLPEGDTVTFVWNTGGPIKTVRLLYEGELCPLGGNPRGHFKQVISTGKNQGQYRWKVPWMDAVHFRVRLIGLSDKGKELTSDEADYSLLPLVCQNRPATAICVSKARQRLYYLKDGQIRRMHVISTAMPGFWTPVMRPGSYDRQRGAMGRVFYKATAPVSRMYEVVMYHWLAITSSGSHGIHATSPPLYSRLGHPASHGCVRQHRADARILWNMVSVGTPVYIL